jgi:hypothetical protein
MSGACAAQAGTLQLTAAACAALVLPADVIVVLFCLQGLSRLLLRLQWLVQLGGC